MSRSRRVSNSHTSARASCLGVVVEVGQRISQLDRQIDHHDVQSSGVIERCDKTSSQPVLRRIDESRSCGPRVPLGKGSGMRRMRGKCDPFVVV